VTQFNIVLTLIGFTILSIGLISKLLRDKLHLSEPMLALAFGVVLGPRVIGLVDPSKWPDLPFLTEELARVTLAIGLMGVALRIPSGFYKKYWKQVLFVITVLLACMWIISGIFIWLFTGYSFLISMLAASALAPTDPIVASSIVTGETAEKNIPAKLRHFISAESGFNDGLGYPFMMICLLLIQKPVGQAVFEWVWRVMLWGIGGAGVFWFFFGFITGKILTFAERKNIIEYESILAFSLAVSLIALGLGQLIGTDGILVVFVTGVAFAQTIHEQTRVHHEHVQEAINTFFTLPSFFLLGAIIPWETWGKLNLPLVTFCALMILLFRRLPAAFLFSRLLDPPLLNSRDTLFYGWFGPIGIAALYYSVHILSESHNYSAGELAWGIGTLTICMSVIIHGATSTYLTKKMFTH